MNRIDRFCDDCGENTSYRLVGDEYQCSGGCGSSITRDDYLASKEIGSVGESAISVRRNNLVGVRE